MMSPTIASARSYLLAEAAPAIPALLRDTQVAAVLGIGRRTVWELARQGALRPVRVSRRATRWRLSDIQTYLAGLTTTRSA